MKTTLLFLFLLLNYFSINAQNALSFDGVDDYVLGTNNESLQLTKGTIEAWIKTNNAGTNYRAIVVKSYNYGIFLHNNVLVVFEWTGIGAISTGVALNDNNWHHIAFSFDNNATNGSNIYIDGVLKLTFTYNVSNFDNNIAVGNQSNLSTQCFNGEIDQVRVWNTIRTDAEILANYNKCLQGNETGLVMLWQFEEGTGTVANDLTGNGNNGTLTNMDATTDWVAGYNCEPQNLAAYYPFNSNSNDESGNNHHANVLGAVLTADKDGNLNSAYYFDGVDDYIDLGDWENGGPMSFTFWARWDAFNNYSRIIDLGNGASSNNIIISNYQTNSGLFFSTYNSGEKSLITTNTITQYQWDFYAATFDINGVMTVYKNGNQINQRTNGISPVKIIRTSQFIGKSNFSQDGYFNGSIDELRIYNSALTNGEILNLYNFNTLKVEKLETATKSAFYVSNNILFFKNNQNLNQIKTIEVYNLLGQKVVETSKIEEEISLQQLKQGVYILKVETNENNLQTLKIIIN
jgi:hypothetical protein